nr:zinc ribbon domain-containing protein [uncultured Blautia sp.]
MFCSKCGKQIPDGTAFCSFCGARQAVNTQTPNFHQEPQKTVKKKKKVNILVWVLAIAGATLIGQMAGKLLAGSYNKKPTSSSKINQNIDKNIEADIGDAGSSTTATTEVKADNPEYMKIFSDRNIVAMPLLAIGQDVASFAKVEEDGTVDSLEFGYKDDLVSTLKQTRYVDITEVTESQRQSFDAEMKEKFAKYMEELGFLTFDSNIGETYYRVSYELQNLDDAEVLKAAEEKGLIELTGTGGLMSMTATESNLLAQGYVKQ